MTILRIKYRDVARPHDEIIVMDGFALLSPFNGAYGPIYDVEGVGHMWPLDVIQQVSAWKVPA